MNMGLRRFHNRVLAILFAVVMMVTSMPQTYLQVLAAQETGITEADKADVDTVFYDNSDGLENIITGSGDDPAGTEEYVTYTFEPGEHVRIYNSEGTEEISELKVLKGSTEEQEFRIRADEGYVIRSVREVQKQVTLLRRAQQDYKDALYFIRPKRNGYQMESTIVVEATPIAEHTVRFSYDPQMAEVSVTRTQGSVSNAVELTVNEAEKYAEFKITNEYSIDFEVRYQPGVTGSVEYTLGDDPETMGLVPDENYPEEGYEVYYFGRTLYDASIRIVTGEGVSITWIKPSYMMLGRARKLGEDEYVEEEGESPYEIVYDDIRYFGTTKHVKGEPLYFYATLDGDSGETIDCTDGWYLTTNGEESGKLQPVGRNVDGIRIYSITPEESMTITGIVLPHTVNLLCDEDVTVEKVEFFDDESYESNGTQSVFAENKKALEIYHETNGLITFGGTAGKTYTIYQIEKELRDGYDEKGEYYEYYVDVTKEIGKIKLEGAEGQPTTGQFEFSANSWIKAFGITSGSVEDASRKVSFDVSNATVYASVNGADAEKLVSGEMVVPKDARVRFRVVPWEGYRVVYVSTTEDAAGALEAHMDGSGLSWYEVTASEDRKLKIVTEEITVERKEVSVYYDSLALESITAKVDGREIEASKKDSDDYGMCTAVYKVPVGSSMNLSVTAGERYTLTDVTVGYVSKRPQGNAWTGDIAVEENETVTVETRGEVYAVVSLVKGESEEPLSLSSAKTYDLYQGKTYSARLYCGKRAAKLDAPIVNGKSLTAQIDPADDTRVLLNVMSGAKGGSKDSLGLAGTVIENGARQIKAAVLCRIAETLESVTCKGPSACTVDTRSVFIVSANPSNAGTMGIGAEVAMEPGMAEELLTVDFRGTDRTGKLYVTVSPKAPVGQKLAVVKLYRTDAEPQDENYYINGGSIDIVVGEPKALKSFVPQVSLAGSDDISLTLALKGADDVGSCVEGSQYYRIEVTPKAAEGTEIPASIKAATEKPFYVARELPEVSEDEEDSAKTPAFVQKTRIIVNNVPSGKGQKWSYEVKVSLVQTGDKAPLVPETENAQVLYRSQDAQTQEFATKDPSFSVKVGVKKLSSTIYTTQQDMAAASLSYDSSAACTGAAAVDITDCAENEKLAVYVEDGTLFASAVSGTSLGKHTIEITPVGPETMYQKPVNFVITVAKGIETLRVDVPTRNIYRQAGKAVSVKTTVIYNEDDTAAKTKKVSWSIVDADGAPLDTESPMYGKVTVKNGKVSIAKTLGAAEDETYEFCVKVQAADFKGNLTSALSPVMTITATPMEDFGKLIAVRWNETTLCYDVVAKDGSAVSSDKLEGAELIALSKDTEVQDSYSQAELESASIDSSLFTVKSSSPKAVDVRNDNGGLMIDVYKLAKNVKLTVTAKDGSKKNASMKLTVQYAKPDKLALHVSSEDIVFNDPSAENKTNLSFKGSVNTVVDLQLMEQTGSAAWKNVLGYTNHAVKVKGGKILYSDAKLGQYGVLVTSDKATVTLTDKDHKVNTSYVITNTGYSTAKAPKIKVKAGTAAKVKAGAVAGRTMTYEIGTGYDGVLVEADRVSERKSRKTYYALEAACAQMGQVAVVKNGAFDLTFDSSNIPAGSYKLTFTPVKSVTGGYEAASKPVNITLKVEKPKATKGSYKPQTSYTLKAAAGEQIALAGKGTNLKSVTFNTLLGMNVKGQENNFLQYFELRDGKLVLKPGLTNEQIAALKANKNDQKGYVTYTAVYGDNGYGVPITVRRTVMITVKLR